MNYFKVFLGRRTVPPDEPIDSSDKNRLDTLYAAFIDIGTIQSNLEELNARIQGAVRSEKVSKMDFIL